MFVLQLSGVLRAVAASLLPGVLWALTIILGPYFCLLARWPSLQGEILWTGASYACKCHPEIQGRDNLLCVVVMYLILHAILEVCRLLRGFLTPICLPFALRKMHPNPRKLQVLSSQFYSCWERKRSNFMWPRTLAVPRTEPKGEMQNEAKSGLLCQFWNIPSPRKLPHWCLISLISNFPFQNFKSPSSFST